MTDTHQMYQMQLAHARKVTAARQAKDDAVQAVIDAVGTYGQSSGKCRAAAWELYTADQALTQAMSDVASAKSEIAEREALSLRQDYGRQVDDG